MLKIGASAPVTKYGKIFLNVAYWQIDKKVDTGGTSSCVPGVHTIGFTNRGIPESDSLYLEMKRVNSWNWRLSSLW